MIIQELINKKRKKMALTNEEIEFLVQGVTKNSFHDYELSALLMAITINGMNEEETTKLTLEMAKSGDFLDLSSIDGPKADKHSTGGISDTTTLVIVPILSALGVKMAKMSGRSLGFTGGTADKLECIDGFNTMLSTKELVENVKKVGACMMTQTDDFAVADKKLYALRDVTETVESIPLIASSIMSKKLASGADIILLDVKFGDGAFMKNVKDATELASLMVKIGKNAGRKMCAIISSMEEPLGDGIGCTLEVKEAIEVLQGAENDLAKVSKVICVEILKLAYGWNDKFAIQQVNDCIKSKKAINKFAEIVANQGGDADVAFSPDKLKCAENQVEVLAHECGVITKMNGEMLGNAVKLMGGGRVKKDDKILHDVGIKLEKGIGDKVDVNTVLANVYFKGEIKDEIITMINNAIEINPKAKPKKVKLIHKIIN